MNKTTIYNLLEEYSNSQVLNNNPNEITKEYILKNFFEPFNIIDIDMNDEDNIKILYNIKKNSNLSDESKDIIAKKFYSEYLNIKKEIVFASLNNYKKEIEEIIDKDKDFMKNIYLILQSEPVSQYLKSKIKLDEKNAFLVNFIDESNKGELPDQCLKDQYEQFISDIKDNYNNFKNLIKIKNLCYKIPALTGPNMKIFINPIMNFSDEAKEDECQMKSILKSALIILLIHEIAHLLKFYPIKNKYLKYMPSTPKGRENGMCIIYHLFGVNKITKINYKQSCLLNDLSTWKNINELKNIFDNNQINNFENSIKNGELDFYVSDIENNIKEIEELKIHNYCYW